MDDKTLMILIALGLGLLAIVVVVVCMRREKFSLLDRHRAHRSTTCYPDQTSVDSAYDHSKNRFAAYHPDTKYLPLDYEDGVTVPDFEKELRKLNAGTLWVNSPNGSE
jgi:hypothetical protein